MTHCSVVLFIYFFVFFYLFNFLFNLIYLICSSIFTLLCCPSSLYISHALWLQNWLWPLSVSLRWLSVVLHSWALSMVSRVEPPDPFLGLSRSRCSNAKRVVWHTVYVQSSYSLSISDQSGLLRHFGWLDNCFGWKISDVPSNATLAFAVCG